VTQPNAETRVRGVDVEHAQLAVAGVAEPVDGADRSGDIRPGTGADGVVPDRELGLALEHVEGIDVVGMRVPVDSLEVRPEAQLDRFLLKIVVGYPPVAAELEMLALHEAGFDPEKGGAVLEPVLDAQVAAQCRALVDGVRVAPEIREYIARLTRATREDPALMLGASPRASVALQKAARASAVLEGRDYVVPDDVKARALSVLRHRVVLSPELEVEGRSPDEVIAGVIARTAAPI